MSNFLQIKDNASARTNLDTLNNITSPITLIGIDTTKLPAFTYGYILTIWDDVTYPNPGTDPNMEKVMVTAAVIGSAATGTLTLSRPLPNIHAGTPLMALLMMSQHINDITTTINANEITLNSHVINQGNVDNTSDINKPVSTAQAAADALKVSKAGDTITGNIIMTDGVNIDLGITTGTKIGLSTTEKLAFFGATPVVQQAATTDLGAVLSNLGLRAVSTTYTLATSGSVVLSGNIRTTTTVRSSAITLAITTPEVQICDATTAAFNVTLPAVVTAGYRYTIKKIDATANAITVIGTIDGATNYVLSTQNKYVTVISTTTSGVWYLIAAG